MKISACDLQKIITTDYELLHNQHHSIPLSSLKPCSILMNLPHLAMYKP